MLRAVCIFCFFPVQENKPVGFSVLQLVVTDKDSSHNGPPFFFTIESGNDDSAFEVNQQGVLLTSAALERKVRDRYSLRVQVSTSVLVVCCGFTEKRCLGDLVCEQLVLPEKTKSV